jgi:hypothetical protein
MGWFTSKPARRPALLTPDECEPLLPSITPNRASNGTRLRVPIGHFFLDPIAQRLVIQKELNCSQTRMNRTLVNHVLATVVRTAIFSNEAYVVISEADFRVLRRKIGAHWEDSDRVRVVDPSVGEHNYWPVLVEEGGKQTIEEV